MTGYGYFSGILKATLNANPWKSINTIYICVNCWLMLVFSNVNDCQYVAILIPLGEIIKQFKHTFNFIEKCFWKAKVKSPTDKSLYCITL